MLFMCCLSRITSNATKNLFSWYKLTVILTYVISKEQIEEEGEFIYFNTDNVPLRPEQGINLFSHHNAQQFDYVSLKDVYIICPTKRKIKCISGRSLFSLDIFWDL